MSDAPRAELTPLERVRIARKAGRLANGFERGKGAIWHAVRDAEWRGGGRALCGAMPAIAWTERQGDEATCPRCRAALAKALPRMETSDGE